MRITGHMCFSCGSTTTFSVNRILSTPTSTSMLMYANVASVDEYPIWIWKTYTRKTSLWAVADPIGHRSKLFSTYKKPSNGRVFHLILNQSTGPKLGISANQIRPRPRIDLHLRHHRRLQSQPRRKGHRTYLQNHLPNHLRFLKLLYFPLLLQLQTQVLLLG